MSSFSVPCNLDSFSFIVFSVAITNWSAWFLASTNSLNLASSASFASASFFIFSMSSLDKLDEPEIVTVFSFPVPKSLADTCTIPFASISNVTSIWGTPLGAGGISFKLNSPNLWLSAALALSPCNTTIDTAGWLSAAVENTCDFLTGTVVFLSIILVNTPPIVSIPNDNGVTSNNNTSLTSPINTPPWIAAPAATTSSGLIDLLGSFPKNDLTHSWTAGILVDPPTNKISSIPLGSKFASSNACLTGPLVASTKSFVNSSNAALVNFFSKCFGPLASIVINGNEICVSNVVDNFFLASSAASFNLWIAILSFLKSIPVSFLNSSANQSIIFWSKLSPPKWLFPEVEITSTTPSPISNTDTSNVPPPKSNTNTFSSFFLSNP